MPNKRWKPEIFTPGPWTPPPEAGLRKRTIYKLELPLGPAEKSQINALKQQKRISRLNPFTPLAIEEAMTTVTSDEVSMIGRLNRLQMKNLYITPHHQMKPF